MLGGWLRDTAPGAPTASFWRVLPSKSYSDDCRRGEALAQSLVDEIQRTHNPSLLAWVVRDMTASKFSGVEIGFLAGIAHRAASLPQHDALDAGAQGVVVEPEHGVGADAVRGDESGEDENPQKHALSRL